MNKRALHSSKLKTSFDPSLSSLPEYYEIELTLINIEPSSPSAQIQPHVRTNIPLDRSHAYVSVKREPQSDEFRIHSEER